ncbi:MAG: alpha/beta hydrolase [Alphaproteobacteria bacterium]|nr:alpha/beta hydrolase [Alphaproteobacteria bacterium]
MNGLIDRDRIWNELEYITCPVLMVRGKENPVDKIEDIRLTQQKLPNSQLIEVENRGQYLVFKEFGDFFKYALVDFEPEDA